MNLNLVFVRTAGVLVTLVLMLRVFAPSLYDSMFCAAQGQPPVRDRNRPLAVSAFTKLSRGTIAVSLSQMKRRRERAKLSCVFLVRFS
jgi:hypothetical protein